MTRDPVEYYKNYKLLMGSSAFREVDQVEMLRHSNQSTDSDIINLIQMKINILRYYLNGVY